MNKKALIQTKLSRQQDIVNAAKEANRDLTAQEQAEFDTLQRDIDSLTAEIATEGDPVVPTTGEKDKEAMLQRAVTQERERISSINDLCREFGMEAQGYIDNGSTIDQVRDAALEHVRKNGAPVAAIA